MAITSASCVLEPPAASFIRHAHQQDWPGMSGEHGLAQKKLSNRPGSGITKTRPGSASVRQFDRTCESRS
eukprot:15357-Chlamydomonas_euryale.AAC.1